MCDFHEIVKMHLDESDKERLVQTIRELVRLSQKVWKQGILSLESDIISLKLFFFRKGMEMVIDGNYPGKIRKVLNNYINNGSFKGIALLERLIIMEGILLIQEGYDTKLMLDTISSMLGEDFGLYIDGLDVLKDDEKFFLDELDKHSFSACKETDLLEDKLTKMNDFKDIDFLIKRVGTYEMALALKGVSSDAMKHIFYHTSDRTVIEDIKLVFKNIGPCRIIDIQEAQKKVVSAMNV